MPFTGQAALLRIYTDEDALEGSDPLYLAITLRARRARMAGATVLRGRVGFGESARVHLHAPLDLADNLPVVIEIVDSESAVRLFAASLGDLDGIGLITVEKVEILRHGAASAASDR
jgi:PII-like signaling protein